MTKFNFPKILVLLISLQLLASYSYSPRVEIEYKGGNKRHIGRYGTLIPLYEPRNSLLFTNMFLMHDSKSSVEGNFGLGFRRQLTNYSILGIYGF
ncbi:MAG: inverse autotransporter beta domain-containing protein [Legionellales bacterium]|nr:inverse autotransporter beta domain-containing protein [Legionellales bacterium]